jgi:hypothetical protein
VRRVVLLLLGLDADADAGVDVLGLARLRAGLSRLALLSGAFLCRLACARLLRRQMKRRLRRLLEGEEVGGRVPCSSVVAKWRHFAAEWMISA